MTSVTQRFHSLIASTDWRFFAIRLVRRDHSLYQVIFSGAQQHNLQSFSDSVSTHYTPCMSAPNNTILVVDDQPHIVSLLKEALGQEGYKMLLAGNAEAALKICEQSPDAIHLLITDLLMPGMNGLELVTHVVARRPEIKVLYISESSVVANAFGDEHGIAFLEKPFSVEALLATVSKLLTAHGGTPPLQHRKYSRVAFGWPITYSGRHIVGGGKVLDLSMGGCSVEGEEPVLKGTDLQLRLAPPEHELPIEVDLARVQWSRGRTFGTEFVHIQTKDHDRLRQIFGTLLSRLPGPGAPK